MNIEATRNIQSTLRTEERNLNDKAVREFLRYVGGDWYLNEEPAALSSVREKFFADADEAQQVERVLGVTAENGI